MVKILLLLLFCVTVNAQENAASYISKSLFECYNKTENLERENRPPADINVLIELLRKIESGKSLQNDREISKEIIHRFKQDGIISYGFSETSQYSVPYSPNGFQHDKHVIYLTQLVPGNAINFPNETLNELERCSLHFMVSNSIDTRVRNDETKVCKKLNQYQSRTKRNSDPNDNVEIFKPFKSSPERGYIRTDIETEPNNIETNKSEFDGEVENVDFETRGKNPKSGITIPMSDCPVENGAVYTSWGTVQIGTVLGAIAAGREPQFIKSDEDSVVNNIFASTLAGDLAEVVLHQVGMGFKDMTTGIKGDWNSTLVPRWYFIEKPLIAQLTEAEIRAGLDGLIIAKNIGAWKNKASSLKISQILDMYYSSRGIFSSRKFRACKRKELFTEVASEQDLISETTAFSFLLNKKAKLYGSILPEGIKEYSKKAVQDLLLKVPGLEGRNCEMDDSKIVRAHASIFIVVDTTWEYDVIQPTITYLLNRLDVTQYDSNFTIINAKTGIIMVNNSNSILSLHEQYTRTLHLQSSSNFDVGVSFSVVEKLVKIKMDEDKPKQRAGGQTYVVLFMPYGPINPTDQQTANYQKNQFKNNLPDIKLLAFGQNSRQLHSSLVLDETNDVFDLPNSADSSTVILAASPVITRIQSIPRRIVNPGCGSTWSSDATNSGTLDQYVDPSGINRYRLAPHYFYTDESNRSLKVKNFGYGTLVVCMSRQNDKLSQNNTSGDTKCDTITSTATNPFTLPQSCDDYGLDSCPPVYISVEGTAKGEESTNIRCTDNDCRFPDNLKYTIEVQGLTCTNNAYAIFVNASLLIITLIALLF